MQLLTNEMYNDGSDGNSVISSNTTDAPIDSAATATAGTNSIAATNAGFSAGQCILVIDVRTGLAEFNIIKTYVAGTITTKYALTNSYANAQVIVVSKLRNFTVNNGITLTAKAWNGTVGGVIVRMCDGTIGGTGTITGSGKGFRGGAGSTGSGNNAHQGESSTGFGVSSTGQNSAGQQANGAGGGGGNEAAQGASAGGGAGHAANGSDGGLGGYAGNTRGAKGNSQGNANLSTLFMGAGGGGGGPKNSDSSAGGAGGAGGAIIILIARNHASSGLTVVSGGSTGVAGSGSGGAGGGGGAGGSILILGQTIDIGTNKVTAPAGNGGAGAGAAGTGGAGSAGRIHISYSGSLAGTATPSADTAVDSTLADSFFGGIA